MEETKPTWSEKLITVSSKVWVGLAGLWVVVAAIMLVYGVLHKFGIGIPEWPHALTDEITLTLFCVTSLGLFATIVKLERRQERTLSAVSRALTNAKESSSVLNTLLNLPEHQRQSVFAYADQCIKLESIKAESNAKIQRVLEEYNREYEKRIKALSEGRINLPLEEAASVNVTIIETFGARMDAVSRDDLKFWKEETGQDYFRQSTGAISKAASREHSRIFVLQLEKVVDEWERVAEILKQHYNANVGFAIVIEETLRDLKAEHAIRDVIDDENSTSLDFALFKDDLVVTFFRNDRNGKSHNGDDGKRFKAIFRIGGSDNTNNKLIEQQRKIWVDLLSEAWLVSSDFMQTVDKRLSNIEKQKFQQKASKDAKSIQSVINQSLDDTYFPIVVREATDLVPKLKQLPDWYNRYHSRRSDVRHVPLH